jgi:hypothetical protein
MTVRIGPHEFDEVSYDEVGDVLYLGRSGAGPVAETDATPEGHAVQFDAKGDGKLVITIPERIEALASELGPALSP